MNRPVSPVLKTLGQVLKDRTSAVAAESLPERWAELIERLSEVERREFANDAANKTQRKNTQTKILGASS